jgi:hypothetical protein
MAAFAICTAFIGNAQAQVSAAWNSIGPAGGTVSALLSSPASPSTLYAGTPENGVFVSTDAGQTWSVANTGLTASTAMGRQTLYTVYALASDGLYVYAATATGLFYAAAGAAPNWTALTGTGATTPITFLAFDSSTSHLYAATNTTDGLNPPGVYVTALATASAAPAPSWNFFALPVSAASMPIGAVSVVPPAQGGAVLGGLLVGIGNSVYSSSIFPATTALTWNNADPAGTLALGSVSALTYSADFLQAYACSGSTVFYSGNPLDAQPNWVQATVAPPSTMAFNCSSFFPASVATGGAPQVLLGTDQGAYVSVDGTSFQATGALSTSAAANSFATATAAGSSGPSAFVGGGFGVSGAALSGLVGNATWSPSNGAASIAAGGSNARLNNVNVVDTAVIGTRLFAAAVANSYGEVFSSTDGGATWTATGIGTVLSALEVVTVLAADSTNSVLFAGTTQGLLAYSVSTGQWSAVGASTIGSVSSLTLGATALFVGVDNGVYAVALGASPASVVPVAAGLSNLRVSAMLVSDGKLYAATLDTLVQPTSAAVSVSVESAAASGTPMWSQFGTTDVGTRRVTSLLFVADTLLAGTSGGLVLSASAASPWASANSGISDPFGIVNGLYSDGVSIFAATGSNGVFVSPVGTALSWSAFNGSGDTALPALEVHTLHGSGSTLYAATRAGIATFVGLTAPTPPPAPSSGGGGGGVDPSFGLLLLAAVLALARGAARKR